MGVSGQRHIPAALYPRERIPFIHWIESWVGLIAGLDTQRLEKSFASPGDRTLVVLSVARYYTVWVTPAPNLISYTFK
jgi:hypothetical protein